MIMSNHVSVHRILLFLLLFGCSLSGIAQNTALDLSGTGNAVNTTYNLDLTNVFTVEQWISASIITPAMLVNQTNNNIGAPLDIYTTAGGGIAVFLGNGSTFQSVGPLLGMTANNWYHIAVVYDPTSVGTEGKIYFNGSSTPVATLNTTAQPLTNIGSLRIGVRADGFEGGDIYIDEVRVWGAPRSGAEIAANYDRQLVGNEANLDIYYQFEGDLNDIATTNSAQYGTATGTIGYVSVPPLNTALNFDGADDLVTIGKPSQYRDFIY
jgi:hypothetical protein